MVKIGGWWTVNSAVGSVMKEEVVQYSGLISFPFRLNDRVDLQSLKSRTANGKKHTRLRAIRRNETELQKCVRMIKMCH